MPKNFWLQTFVVVLLFLLSQLDPMKHLDDLWEEYLSMDALMETGKNILTFVQSSDDNTNADTQSPATSDHINARSTVLYYQSLTQNKEVPKNERLAFGYVADSDVTVDAARFMQALGYATPPSNFGPHDNIDTLQQFVENFAFYYSVGAGVEVFTRNKTLFAHLIAVAHSVKVSETLGGNSPTMARRAQIEGCAEVILASEMSRAFYEDNFDTRGGVLAPVTLVGEAPLVEGALADVHLCLEYSIDTVWGPLTTPRANRLYTNHDDHNPRFSKMDDLHARMMTNGAASDILAVSGFQLMNFRDLEGGTRPVLEALGARVSEVRARGTKVHAEMATFTDYAFFAVLVREVLAHADSIGLNEQELGNLHAYVHSRTLIDAVPSNALPSDVLRDLVALLANVKLVHAFEVTRVHLHALNFQAICSDTREWGDGEYALAKSVLVALQLTHTVDENDDAQAAKQFDFDLLRVNFPKNLTLHTVVQDARGAAPRLVPHTVIVGEEEGEDAQNPITCWKPFGAFQCCVAPQPYVRAPKRTTGLGDNISAMGLVYQKILFE